MFNCFTVWNGNIESVISLIKCFAVMEVYTGKHGARDQESVGYKLGCSYIIYTCSI